MKRINIMLMVAVMFIVGCTSGSVQINQESQEAIAKITGRRVGYELAIQYPPDIAQEVNTTCQEIVAQDRLDFIEIATNRLAVVLIAEIEDPLLAADIQDILALIKIKTDIKITDDQIKTIKAVAAGLISGIKIGDNRL